MRDWENWAAGAALIICLLIAWFAPIFLHLTGANLWILRGGLGLVAVAGVGALWWWLHSKRGAKLPSAMPAAPAAPAMPGIQPPAAPAAAGAAVAMGGAAFGGAAAGSAGSPQDIDVLMREAERRLKTSQKVHGATISSLPAVFLVGEAGSGKTSVVLNSGLDPELLAGQVSQDGAIVSTRAVNAWFARQAVFVEAGSALLGQPGVWTRLVKRLKPGASILSKGGQAPRAVVVCVDCETLAKPGGAEAVMNTARILQPRLREFAERLGINLPVYVLFSKLDRVAFFTQYVDNLSHQEATDVLGVTLPIRPQDNAGIYAEQETKRLSAAFDELFYSLSDRRLMYLPREHSAETLPPIYEFPREFRKLRNSIVQFLVDLCRPSQLRTGPFLRGFYFTGQRTVVMDRAVQAQPQAAGGVPGATRSFNVGEAQGGAGQLFPDANATFVFDARRAAAASAPEALRPIAQPRQVQQPVYLSHLFSDVVLQDHAAMGTSGASTKSSFWRRLLLATAIVVFLVASIGFLVSYFGNRELEVQVAKAAQGLAPYPELTGAQVPTFDALQRLDGLRQTLVTLREPPPWHLRWGLYVGDDLYAAASQIYFASFRKLLFAQTQGALLDSLRPLPATPGPQDDYKSAYDALKAYLITTSNHDKSTREFLSPVLLADWSRGRDAGEDRRDLARRQFDFYSEVLAEANPYSSANDARIVAQARTYLSHFAGTERVYQSMLAAASARNKAINFNRDFPGSAEVVINHVDVAGAFTKGGWTFMQDAIKHPERFFSGEEWVLGPQVAANLPDPATLSQTLRARYQDDFVKQWHAYLNGTTIVHYQGLPDAARKLTKLSGNPSALLEDLCVAATNTAVDSPDVALIFQPAQFVTPPPCQEQLISSGNKPYMDGLVALESCLEQIGTAPPAGKDQAKAQCSQVAGNAKVATRQVAQGFKIDQQQRIDAVVQRIMLDPIASVEGSLMPSGPAGAGSLCAALNTLAQKAPFRLNATDQASLQDIENIFNPGTGMLTSYYSQNLTNFLTLQGSEYVASPTSPVKINPVFLSFFNRAIALQHALYPATPPQLQFHYSLRPRPTPGGPSFTLTLDGQTLKYTGGTTVQPTPFVWPGATQGANLSVVIGGAEVTFASYQGPMSTFQFFANSKWAKSGPAYSVEWSVLGSSGQLAQLNGKPLIITFDLDTKGADPIFRPGYFSSLGCVSKVSQ